MNSPELPQAPDHSELFRELAGSLAASRKNWMWLWLPGILVLAIVVLLVLHFGEIETISVLLGRANPAWLIPAALVQFATYVCAAGVWWRALNILGQKTSLPGLVPLGFAKLFMDQALPTGGVSGALLAVVGLVHRAVPFNVAFIALLAGMISYYAVYALLALASVIILAAYHKASAGLLAAALSLVLVAAAIPLVVLAIKRNLLKFAPSWLGRFKSSRQLLAIASRVPLTDLRNARLLVDTSVFQVSVFLLDALTLWMALRMIGIEAPYTVAIAAHVLGTVASTLGVVPLGLGTFEGGAVAILALADIPLEAGLSAVLLTRALTFWMPMLPGLWLTRQELRRARILGGEPHTRFH